MHDKEKKCAIAVAFMQSLMVEKFGMSVAELWAVQEDYGPQTEDAR